jgi:excisionase family DNA binding protein
MRQSATPTAPLLVNAKTAARMLSIGARLLWTMTNAGEIPCVRIGRRVLYRVEALRTWTAEREAA